MSGEIPDRAAHLPVMDINHNTQTPSTTTSKRVIDENSNAPSGVCWFTIQEVFDRLGETFDVDPASPGIGRSHVPAKRFITEAENGLTSPWGDNSFVWLNPPYDFPGKWMHLLANHPGGGIALIRNSVGAKWFHETVPGRATVVCFVNRRLGFHDGHKDGAVPTSSNFDNVFVAYGERAAAALIRANFGWCVPGASLADGPGAAMLKAA